MITTVTIHHTSTLEAQGKDVMGQVSAVQNFLAALSAGIVLYDKFEVTQVNDNAPASVPAAA